MIEFEKPNITKVDEGTNYGKFVVEPLERGYGTTLGNSLRRILLSSLPGAAVSSIQIDGVLHEFTTVDGVLEDVTQIILNIKKLALKLLTDDDKTVEIDVQGPATVTAADIVADGDVEVLNPEQYICTVAEGGHFHVRMTIKKVAGMWQLIKIKLMTCQLASYQSTRFSPQLVGLTTKLKAPVLVGETTLIS